MDDASGHSADVGAAMTTDFGFIANTAEGDAGEFAAKGIGHAFAEGSLANTRRSGETKNGSFDLLAAFDDGDEFEQAVFDFFEAEMLLV